MRVILLLPILSILRLCFCGGNGQDVAPGTKGEPPPSSPGSPPGASDTPSPTTTASPTPPKDVKLDITDVDLRVVTMSESFLDGILVRKTFTPNDGCRLMEVLDMNLPIWTSTDPKEHAKSVVVHYDGDSPVSLTVTHSTADGKAVSRFYDKEQNGSWKEVDQDTPSQKHQGMKNDTTKEIPTGGVPTVQPASPSGQQPSTNEGEYIEKSTRNTPIVPFEEAMRELDYFREILRTKVPFSKVPEYTLDIADDKSKKLHFVKLYGEIHNGFKQKKYVPMYGKNMRTDDGTFTKVVDGDTVIWTAKPDERCGYVSCLRQHFTKHLLTIAVAGRGDFIQYDRFMKEGNEWKSVTVEEFQKKMTKIRTCKKCCGFIPSCWKYGNVDEAVYGIANMDSIVRGTAGTCQGGACSSNLKK